MAIAMLLEWSGMDEEQYLELVDRVALGDRMFPGAMLHLAGPTEDGWRAVDVWESQDAFDRFFQEKLQQASMDAKVDPPSVHIWPVFAIRTPQGEPEPQR